MIDKLEVTIDVIIHATEDISQIYQSFEKLLDLKEENFTTHETTGHYDNPIILLNAKIVKKEAQNFMKKLLGLLSIEQINELIEDIEALKAQVRDYDSRIRNWDSSVDIFRKIQYWHAKTSTKNRGFKNCEKSAICRKS
mgnify:CR=1 FL=1